ncbi:E3 ubiquitin-protein ligase UPL3 [Echinococcus granulosus]|nr:E3 ubiquitin-protein ligase UPL3 [Echinococcus granulosus]
MESFSHFSKLAHSDFEPLILNLLDGLIYITLYEENEPFVVQQSPSICTTADDPEIRESWKRFQAYVSFRVSTEVKESPFASFFVPQDGQDYSPFRSKLDNLGLSNDLDIVSNVFHLWIKRAIVNKTSIVDILMAMNAVQMRTCWYDLGGRSLLASAVDSRYPSAMMALVNRGSDPNSGLKETPLHVAASQSDLESLRFLLSLRNSNVGVATNPLLRDTLGRTPRECCEKSDLAELLRINEEEFQAQFGILQEGTSGQLMKKSLPLLIRGYNTSMNPLLRLQALCLITRVCRSCPGYAMINLTLKEEEQETSKNQTIRFSLRTQLLNLITSGLNQGCTSEACQVLSLISALVDHPGVREGLQRHGVLEFLSWRLEAEALLKENLQDVSEHEKKWIIYLPNDLTDPEVTHYENTENPSNYGNSRVRPQCIYEISWDQAYQFGDWFVLRSGNSSVVILQEYVALYIEVKLRQILDYLMVPTIFATLLTCPEVMKGEETQSTPEIDQARARNLEKLEAKTIILGSSAEGGQIRDNEDATSQWLKCQACIMRTCGCKAGVIPLPLKCTQAKVSSPETLHGTCGTLLCKPEYKLPIEKTVASSSKLAPEDRACVTKKTSIATCRELNPEKRPLSAPTTKSPSDSTDNHRFVDLSTPNQESPSIFNFDYTRTRLRTTESDFESEGNQNSKTKVNPLNRLTAGLLSLSVSSSGLVVGLREAVGAERYLKALETADNEMVTCNHIECTGAFDPDFYRHSIKSWIKDREEQKTAKQTLLDDVSSEKIIISPSRFGGVRFFGTDGSLIYRANAFSRTARLQRLHPFLESLTLSQRKLLRTFYRSCYLRKLRDCFIQRGTELLETLKPIVTAEYSKYTLTLMSMARTCENITKSECKTHKIELSQCPSLHDSISNATPYEVVTSELIPALLALFKHCSHDRLRDLCSWGDSSVFNNGIVTSQQRVLKNLFEDALEGLIRKLIETFELFERYPLALPNLGGSYEQLVQRSIYLQPKLRGISRTQSPSMAGRQIHSRKVDLSNYRIYTAPLVTFHQLRNWLQEKTDNSPWYMDVLESVGFMQDVSKPDQEILLVPPSESVANLESDVTKVEKSENLKIYFGGLFHWLSTNGGRELKNRVNPARFFKRIKISTSDTKINNRPFHLSNIIYKEDSNKGDEDSTQTHSPVWIKINVRGPQSHIVPMLNQPWIFIDTGFLLETSHYLIKVPMSSGQWPRLQHWKLLASDDSKSWDLLSEHHVYPRGQTPSSYWGSQGERIWAVNSPRTPYRFYWLISLLHPHIGSTEPEAYPNSGSTPNLSLGQLNESSNFIELQNIEFYGCLKSVCLTSKFDVIEDTVDYLAQIKPGIIVVLKNFQLPESYLKEIWPPSSKNDGENPPWLSEASSLSLGLVLSRVESGYATVAWFKPIPNENQGECSSCVVIERSPKGKDNSSQPSRFIFSSHVVNHTSLMELALPDPENLALQSFAKNIALCGNLTTVMEEEWGLRQNTATQNSVVSIDQPLGEEVIRQKKGETLETLHSPQLSASTPVNFGQLVLPYCGEAFRLSDFHFNISFYGSSLSPLRTLHSGSSTVCALDSSSQDVDYRLTAPHAYDILTRGIDSSNQSKIATLDANLPGFIPPFDSRSGSQSQPATIAFDPSEGNYELRGETDLRSQKLHLWLSWNRSDPSEDGMSASSLNSVKITIPGPRGQQPLPNSDISIFHCWMEGIGVAEEFPGCGRLKRPISPTLSNCQRTYTLNYSYDLKPSAISEEGLHGEDNASLIYSSLDKLPFIIPHSDNTPGQKITSADLVEQCLSLLHILHDVASSSDPNQQPLTSFFKGGVMNPMSHPLSCAADAFFSSRLRRKVQTFMDNPWSIIQAAGNPVSTKISDEIDKNSIDMITWCRMLMQKYHFLFPFSIRVDFWQVTSLGLGRSITWLQQQQQRQTGGQLSVFGGIGGAHAILGAYSQSADVESNSATILKLRISASDFSYLWGPSILLNFTKESDKDLTCTDDWIEDGSTPVADNIESLNRLPHPQTPPLGFDTSTVTSTSSSPPSYTQANGLNLLGRLQREVASVPRPSDMEEDGQCSFWPAAVRLLIAHATRKQELEVGFENEEGTGLGPTMEFYALISAELMRKSHCIWVADYASTEKGFGEHVKIAAEKGELEKGWRVSGSEKVIYVHPRNGLFPAAWPANALPQGAEERFRVLGIALAKCLQDQRRMDLHFSTSFLKLLMDHGKTETSDLARRLEDFMEIYPEQGKFFLLCLKYLNCAKTTASTPEDREQLEVKYFSSKLSDLCLTMEFPSITTKFGQSSFRLEDRYDWDNPESRIQPQQHIEEAKVIDYENLEIYIKRSIDFAMNKGIEKQIKALRDGFNLVFPLETLAIFTPDELSQLISGDMSPNKWTYEEMLAAFEPVAGYTRQSPTYLMLLDVLLDFTGLERKCFVKFVTGSPNLPPGGFRNLHPKIKVAKKDAGTSGPYPSVNTCMHYLKLPEYDTAVQLKEKLLDAATQPGFFLN